METIELLAPAGNEISLRAAVENGADAVYMGLDNFNARKMTENFGIEEYKEAIKYAHKRNVKIYLTMNVLMYDEELEEALKSLIILYKNGLDGVIVQDLGLAKLIHKVLPNLSMHASTQMTVHNLKQVKLLESLGFSRVVLARELNIEEIKNICQNTKLEIEVFVHGALCVCYSGQCLISSMIGKRSGNRGSCAQPCRTKYSLNYRDNENSILKNMNLLSKKDIYGIEHIEKLKEAGIKSLKIEGRNKVPEYVATVISKYRKKIDKLEYTKQDEKELLQIFNRSGKSFGYLAGVQNNVDSISYETAKNTGHKLGKVIEQKNSFIKIKIEEDLDMHDGVEVHSKNKMVSTIVTCIRDDKFKIKNDEVKANEIVWIGDFNENVAAGDIVYKTSSKKLNEKLKYTFEKENTYNKKTPVIVNISIKKDEKVYGNIILDKDHKAEVILDYIPVEAKTVEITKETISEKFINSKDTVFDCENTNVEIDRNLYIPVSKINELKRNLFSKLEDTYLENKDVENSYIYLEEEMKKLEDVQNKKMNHSKNVIKKTAYIYNFSKEEEYTKIAKQYDRIYLEIEDFVRYEKDIIMNFAANEIYICLPNIIMKNLEKYIDNNLERILKLYPNIKGIVISNIAYLSEIKALKYKYNLEVVSDYQMNVTNIATAEMLIGYGIDKFCMMPDLEECTINKFMTLYNIEILNSYVTVMTSRYCVLGAFLSHKEKCEMPCMKNKYMLKDFKNENLYIISKPQDCIMRLVKKIKETKYSNNTLPYINKRECII